MQSQRNSRASSIRKGSRGKTINVDDTLEMLSTLKKTAIENAKLDIGRLTFEWANTEQGAEEFIVNQLSSFFGSSKTEARDVVLFGLVESVDFLLEN